MPSCTSSTEAMPSRISRWSSTTSTRMPFLSLFVTSTPRMLRPGCGHFGNRERPALPWHRHVEAHPATGGAFHPETASQQGDALGEALQTVATRGAAYALLHRGPQGIGGESSPVVAYAQLCLFRPEFYLDARSSRARVFLDVGETLLRSSVEGDEALPREPIFAAVNLQLDGQFATAGVRYELFQCPAEQERLPLGVRPQGPHRAAHVLQGLARQALGVTKRYTRFAGPRLLERYRLFKLNVDHGQIVSQAIVDITRQAVALFGGRELSYLFGIRLQLPVRFFKFSEEQLRTRPAMHLAAYHMGHCYHEEQAHPEDQELTYRAAAAVPVRRVKVQLYQVNRQHKHSQRVAETHSAVEEAAEGYHQVEERREAEIVELRNNLYQHYARQEDSGSHARRHGIAVKPVFPAFHYEQADYGQDNN